jgi:hypothetical protein
MARGEAIIKAGNREVRIWLNNRALAEAEGQMKRPIFAVLNGFASGQTGLTEMGHILRAGMNAARRKENGKPATLAEAFGVLDKAGFKRVAEAVAAAASETLGYDPDKEEGGEGSEKEEDPNE